jgi:hypothetical protein
MCTLYITIDGYILRVNVPTLNREKSTSFAGGGGEGYGGRGCEKGE